MGLKSVKLQINTLSSLEKIKLIELLFHSLEQAVPELENEWVEEAENRFKLYDEGHVKGIPAEKVFKKYDL